MKNKRKCVSLLEQCETDLLCPKVSTVQYVIMFAQRLEFQTLDMLYIYTHSAISSALR